MEYYQQFSSHLKIEEGLADSSIEGYVKDVKRFRRWLDTKREGGVPPTWENVITRDLRGYLAYLATERTGVGEDGKTRHLRPVKEQYVRRLISSFQRWFDYLIEVEELDFPKGNPTKKLSKPKLPSRHPPYLTPQQVSTLITTAAETSRVSERVRNWTLIAFFFYTGLRVSEMCNLKEGDVRWLEAKPHSLRVIGKGNKERKVLLKGEAQRALMQWLREREALIMDLPPGGDAEYIWLIPSGRKRGKRITPGGVRKMLRTVGNKAGITVNEGRSVYTHLLRHSFATAAAKGKSVNGRRERINLHALRDAMGHSSLATTGKYLHADEEELETVAAILPNVLDDVGTDDGEVDLTRLIEDVNPDDLDELWVSLSKDEKLTLLQGGL